MTYPPPTAHARAVASVVSARFSWSAAILAAPFLFYLVPFLAGYGWSAVNPRTPAYPGMTSLSDRQPAVTTAVEHYGTGVVAVPFQARLRAYLRDGDLPLWNPYSGLGQPFAAQGEGSPYFPLAILRSLLPASWSNLVTFASIGISAISMYGFLRVVGPGTPAAAFGGAAWALSGVFTPHLARPNYVDQFAMIPPLFLAAAWAIASRRTLAYVALALTVGLHAVAGLLQIGVNTLLLLAGFLVLYSSLKGETLRGRVATVVVAGLFVGLGTALAAPYVLPIVEGVRAAYNKNVPNLAFLPMPTANVVMFFFPLVFGQVFQGWLAGTYPNVADWNNLYAHGSTGALFLAVLALAALHRAPREQRLVYLFFVGGLLFFLTRYLSLPPGAWVSSLPILNQQSPKHTNGPAVFCLVVAAAFGMEWLRRVERRWGALLIAAVFLLLAVSLGVLVWRHGGLAAVDTGLALVHLSVTIAVSVLVLLALWLAHRAPTDGQAALIAAAAVVGESSLYLLLGTHDLAILAARLGVGVLVGLTGLLAARGMAAHGVSGRDVAVPESSPSGMAPVRALWPAALTGLLAVAAYAGIVVWPASGLPKRADLDVPLPYMRWLQAAAGQEYRAFGIYPDYASIAEIQDVEVVGPLATNAWVAFVDLVSSAEVAKQHRIGSTFSLDNKVEPTIWYDLTRDYPRARPLLDWAGVRYLVLDKATFNPGKRRDHEPLLAPSSGLRVAYDDETVTILESPTAQSKAFFTTRVRETSAETVLAALRADPRAVDGQVAVTGGAVELPRGDPRGPSFAVPLAEYHPNGLRATFEAPAGGVFVVKDSYFPGWQATLDGQPAEVLEVDGLVRGVVVPAAGRHDVTMTYRPASFVNGVWIGAAALALLAALLTWDLARAGRRR